MGFQPGVKTASGYLAIPESGSGPGVLVLHAWWGLNDFFIQLCDRLAQAGFVALAPDLYSGDVVTSVEEAMKRQQVKEAADTAVTQATAIAALETLQNLPAVRGQRVGTLGCSMGVWWSVVLAAARPESIAATVMFYGVVGGDFAASTCAYQAHFAENDQWDSVEQAIAMAAEIQDAGKEIDFYVYPGVGHWFFEADRPDAYDADSARLAWERTIPFLKFHLGEQA